MKKKYVFLDRDGTLIQEVNFLATVEETKVFPFTIEALKLLKEAGYSFAMTTNQSGVARGHFPDSAVVAIYDEIMRVIGEEGLSFDSLQFCPHMPDAGCRCRKPSTGMIEKAVGDQDVDLSECWTIGDKKLDIEMGFNAGTQTCLVSTGYGADHAKELTKKPDFIAKDLLGAAKKIVGI